MTLIPIGKRILVSALPVETHTASGLIIPDAAKERPRTGKIVAVSELQEMQDLFNVGEHVMYSKFAGTEVREGFDDYLALDIQDIIVRVV